MNANHDNATGYEYGRLESFDEAREYADVILRAERLHNDDNRAL